VYACARVCVYVCTFKELQRSCIWLLAAHNTFIAVEGVTLEVHSYDCLRETTVCTPTKHTSIHVCDMTHLCV